MKNLYEDEISLKEELNKFNVRFGDRYNKWSFVVEFVDNKNSNALITRGIYASPVGSVRDFGEVLKARQLPKDDVDINLVLAYSDTEAIKFDSIFLSPYLYYKKPEENNEVINEQDSTSSPE